MLLARPQTTVILAMSADGKLADAARSPARFGSAADKHHLEAQVAAADAVLFGAATLRAYGTTLPITSPALLTHRQAQGKAPQPWHIVCSAAGNLDPNWRFFQQPVPRWLLTTPTGAQSWTVGAAFDRIVVNPLQSAADWVSVFQQLPAWGIAQLAVLGGGELVATLVAAGLVDELQLTLCPLLLGGKTAPTPMDGVGFPAAIAPQLELLSVQTVAQEVFLRYQVRHPPATH